MENYLDEKGKSQTRSTTFLSLHTGRPRYMRSFYLRFRVYAIEICYPLIYRHPWSFYMQIHYMRA